MLLPAFFHSSKIHERNPFFDLSSTMNSIPRHFSFAAGSLTTRLNFSMFLPSRNKILSNGSNSIYRGPITPFITIVGGPSCTCFYQNFGQVLVLVRRPPRRCYTTQWPWSRAPWSCIALWCREPRRMRNWSGDVSRQFIATFPAEASPKWWFSKGNPTQNGLNYNKLPRFSKSTWKGCMLVPRRYKTNMHTRSCSSLLGM